MSYLGNTRLPRETFDKLPDGWQQMLMAMNNQFNAPVELCLPLMLSVVSTATQQMHDVSMWKKFHYPTSLFAMPMVDASGGKSSIFKVICRGISKYDKYLADGWEERNREYQVLLGRYNKALKAAANDENDTSYTTLKEPEKVLGKSIMCSKPTLNYIISQFNTVPGVYWKNEDAGEVFNGHSFNTPGKDVELVAALSKLFSGETAAREVAIIGEASSPYNRRISIGWTCQEALASDILNNEKFKRQGILNRFIFVKVDPFPKPRESDDPAKIIESELCQEIFDVFANRVFEMLKFGQQEQVRRRGREDAPLDPFELQLDTITHDPQDGSIKLHMDFHNRMLDMAEDPANENLRGFYERCSELVARIAANIATYEGRDRLSYNDIECAIGIVEWVRSERASMHVAKNYTVSKAVDQGQELYDWLKKRKYTTFTKTLLNNNCKSIWGKMDSDERVRALEWLQSSEKVEFDDATKTWTVK